MWNYFPPLLFVFSNRFTKTKLALTPTFDAENKAEAVMEVKERRPYRSLTARQDAERRYTSSSADSEDGKPNPKSYSSTETLKAFDHDSRMAYGTRVKDMVHHEVDEFGRQGRIQKAVHELYWYSSTWIRGPGMRGQVVG